MDYKNRFKRLKAELLLLLEKYIKEWDEAQRDTYDIDEIMKQVVENYNQHAQPVNYS